MTESQIRSLIAQAFRRNAELHASSDGTTIDDLKQVARELEQGTLVATPTSSTITYVAAKPPSAFYFDDKGPIALAVRLDQISSMFFDDDDDRNLLYMIDGTEHVLTDDAYEVVRAAWKAWAEAQS